MLRFLAAVALLALPTKPLKPIGTVAEENAYWTARVIALEVIDASMIATEE